MNQIQSRPTPEFYQTAGGPVLVASQPVTGLWHNWAVNAGFASQLVRVAAPFTVAAVALFLKAGVPNNTTAIEFRTAPDRGGALIGPQSSALATVQSVDGAWYWFNWPVTKPTLAADCYLTAVTIGFFPAWTGYASAPGGTLYEDATFCVYDALTAWPNSDLAFYLLALP